MQELYELKEKLCKELKSYGKKEVTASSLTMVDTLAHALKNIDKVIEKYEEEEGMYSSMGMPIPPAHEGGYMRGSYDNGRSMNSYARGRGRYARRDAMGRYSRDGYSGEGKVISELEDLMANAPDERTRQKLQDIIYKMGEM